MTDEMMNVRLIVEKTPGAGHGEKSPTRLVQRNDYRDRDERLVPARSSCASPSYAAAATDEIDSILCSAWYFFLRGRPRGEVRRDGWKRRQAPLLALPD